MKIKIFWVILFSLFAINVLVAQTKVKKRDINRINDQAEEAFYNEDYRKALSLYQQLFQMNPEGSDYYNYQIALCYLYSNIDNEKAMSYIDMAKESMAETPVADLYYYNLGKSSHLNNKYQDAIDAYEKALNQGVEDKEFRKEIEQQIQLCRNALEISSKPLEVKISNVGELINTQYAEYRPLISADESILIFTSRREGASNGKLDVDGRNFEDIYISEKDELGYWKAPGKISANINSELHEASVGLSPDGRELLIYKGNPDWGGLFLTRLIGTEWTTPQLIGENINSKKFQETSASISADGKFLYFISNRKGSVGEKDIWKAAKEQNGEWGKAINLGPVINTLFDEESPFIHPDGKTLYFSSKGHNTMGGYDIFKSVLENGKWSKPENIGYPINTPGDDVHFVLTADGKNGYFTSSRTGTLGEQDIYKVGFDISVPLILVKGIVKKDDPGEFKVAINIIDKATNKLEEFVYNPNPVTGKYLMILPPGKNYDMVVEAENYQPQIININIPDQKEFFELYQEIILRKTPKKGEVAQEITVTNYFADIRQAKKNLDSPIAEIGNVASSDYLENEMKKLIAASGKQGKNSDSVRAGIDKINQLTDKVSDNFDKILEAKIPTEILASSVDSKNEKNLAPVKIGDNTIYAVPSSSFTAADINQVVEERQELSMTGELEQLHNDLAKAKSTTKTGNYIVDLANERYVENLEEEIAAIEGGYAIAEKKEKKEEYTVAIKKETSLYGTQTTSIIDKEKQLEEREAAVAQKEEEQNELIALRNDLEKAKSSKPTGNYITDLANQRYIENLEEEISAISGGYSPRYKRKEGFAEVKKETGLYGTTTTSGSTAVAEKKEEKAKEGTVASASSKEKEMAEREKAIAKKEAELVNREKELAKREYELALREASLAKAVSEKSSEAKTTPLKTSEKETNTSGISTKQEFEKIIFFEYNKADISSQYNNDLLEITTAMTENAVFKVEISAHTDAKGTDQYNLNLSRKRAENVKKFLVSNGIKGNRISMKYFGESQPLSPNANPDGTDNPGGRDKNRRAEIRVKN